MCVGGGGAPATQVPAAPSRPTASGVSKTELVTQSAKKMRDRLGIFSNIRTSSAGDPLYGTNVASLASFGSA